MFRKIRSNRDPNDTLLSELQKEFSVYLSAASKTGRAFSARYPVTVFSCMVVLLIGSGVFAVIFHHPQKKEKVVQASHEPYLQDGFARITAAGTALNETIRLKTHVDSLLAKPVLSGLDSIELLRSLDSLRHLSIH